MQPSRTLTATRYTDILDKTLVPFVAQNYPVEHRFQQVNDPKHTSRRAQSYFEEKQINYLHTTAKPKNTQELIDVIKSFGKH